jgi:hypothetical protein
LSCHSRYKLGDARSTSSKETAVLPQLGALRLPRILRSSRPYDIIFSIHKISNAGSPCPRPLGILKYHRSLIRRATQTICLLSPPKKSGRPRPRSHVAHRPYLTRIIPGLMAAPCGWSPRWHHETRGHLTALQKSDLSTVLSGSQPWLCQVSEPFTPSPKLQEVNERGDSQPKAIVLNPKAQSLVGRLCCDKAGRDDK